MKKSIEFHDDVINWTHFPRNRWPVNSPLKSQWRRALMFPLICAWINVWANSREPGDFRRHHAHYDVTVMIKKEYIIRFSVGLKSNLACHLQIHFWYFWYPYCVAYESICTNSSHLFYYLNVTYWPSNYHSFSITYYTSLIELIWCFTGGVRIIDFLYFQRRGECWLPDF